MNNLKEIILNPYKKLLNSMQILQKYRCKIVMVCDESNKLLGIISDGDVRRYLLSGGTLEDQSHKAMNKNPFILESKNNKKTNLKILKDNNFICAPIVNKKNQVVDFLFPDFLHIKRVLNPVVIMAGGQGKRLQPLTNAIPKPLIRIGKETILEMIIKNLSNFGYEHFFISVNYLKKQIIDHLGDGSKLNVNLQYLQEKKYLGTAGSLSLLKPKPSLPTLVINSDIITNIDFDKFLKFHIKNKGIATMAVREFITNLPYGVIDEENGIIKDIKEKPHLTNFINAGIYILNPEFFDLIPSNEYSDMTDIFKKAIKKKKNTYYFQFYDSWFEIGRQDDLERVRKVFNE